MRVRLTKLRPLSGSVLICSSVDRRAQLGGRGLHERRLPGDGHRLLDRADLELDVDADALIDAEVDASGALTVLKPDSSAFTA